MVASHQPTKPNIIGMLGQNSACMYICACMCIRAYAYMCMCVCTYVVCTYDRPHVPACMYMHVVCRCCV